ncbi:MAG: SDR family NAD(P)-dependent oxidoreductase [Rhodospirillaceae bacterium]|jgi:NAD(P)-dependent dehydrogenase (short-subunit alcohol dehydrogenase family)|nr:SDR family NAD(P)-dependent oxidoreductase [Rhodospirillaceae bacterium]MBT3883744.1 SDR family NAD(P)-dependent oxidoreductase [Rhodospirillaceae bacterium]MBT4116338.1 SDR family NAD(P)-dependent oxidoreductase [Rhodospirillaceae bacterium]MBT4751001.1 SDR family NAD(P)-dependent oxidoreductase [Rhodospirillaceae bacterium]MBT5179891.1 SDR family NAD(P)-dependent oxidoreductase [Rhodospirillaceae bacterium]
MADKSVLIVGAGAGLGASLGRCFAGAGYNIAVAARRPERLEGLITELTDIGVKAEAFGVDASDEDGMAGVFDAAEANLGSIDLALYNVNGRTVKELTELSIDDFENSWRALCLGGFIMGREAAKRMLPRGAGSIFYTGGRGARRGLSEFTAFASAKAALRSVAECTARELGPKGIHVAHFAVEASIASEATRAARPELAEKDAMVRTEDLAEIYLHTHQQPRNCWAFEVDLRPWNEIFI